MFFIFVATSMILSIVFYLMRRSPVAIIAALIFAFLPLPLDKLIEIRPDNVATFLNFMGIFLTIVSMRKLKTSILVFAGVCYSASILMVPKNVPAIVFAVSVFYVFVFTLKTNISKRKNLAVWFSIGLGLPLVVFGVWILSLGNLSTVWYSLTKLPLEANKISKVFFMGPDLFFYPNSVYYGVGGITFDLVINHILWIVGIGMGIYRLFLPALGPGGTKKSWEEVLMAGSFFINVAVYVLFIPLKHAQYLIPISAFVSWYVADAVYIFWQKISRHSAAVWYGTASLLLVFALFYTSFITVNSRKITWTNAESLKELSIMWATIPKDEYVLDLEGRTLYYPDPYYVCCLPFGQFAPFLSRTLPSLSEVLKKTNTRYIYQGQLGRISTLLPADQVYIDRNYELSSISRDLLVRHESN